MTIKCVKVKTVKRVSNPEYVGDIGVVKNHNLFISKSLEEPSLLVHNCWGIAARDEVLAKTFAMALKCIYDLRLNSDVKSYLVFKYESDTHKINYSNFTGVPVREVTKDQRQAAKGIVFGCFTADTIVTTAKGPERLGVLHSKGKKVTVLSKSGSYRKSDGVVSQGVKSVVQVITRQGAITGTNDHHVLTVTKDCKLEMKPLRLLKLNDYIVYRSGTFGTHIPKLAGREISTLDAEAMGLFTGDGSSGYYNDGGMGCYRVHHCSIDKREVNKVRQFIRRYTGINPPLTKTKATDFKGISINKNTEFYYTQLNNKLMYTLLKDFGLSGTQHVRRVPDFILKAKKEIVAAYLRGYFEADGGFRVTKSKGHAQISVTSVNINLLTDVSYLLRLFGIVGKIYRYERHARLSSITNDMEVSGELIISHNDSILAFLNEIGFITEKKRNIAKVVRKTIKAKRYQKPVYDLPINYSAIRDTYIERAGVNTFRARDVFVEGVHVLPIPHGLRTILDNILLYKDSFCVLGLADEWNVLSMFADRNCFASAVISEQTDKGHVEVFDVINVNKENKWVANGMIVSNSLYGIGDYSLAASIGRTLEETREIKVKFFKKYAKGAKWMKVQCEETIHNNYVTSMFGRRRNLIGHKIPVGTLQAAFERRAQNSPIQGVASDMGYIGARLYTLALDDVTTRFEIESNKDYMIDHGWEDYMTSFDRNPSFTPVGIDSMVHDSIKSQVRYDMYYIAIYLKEWAMTTGVRAYAKKYLGVTFNVDLGVEFDIGASAATMNTWGWVAKDLTVVEGDKTEVIKCLDTLFKEALEEQVAYGYPINVKSIMKEAKARFNEIKPYLLKTYPLPIQKYIDHGVIN